MAAQVEFTERWLRNLKPDTSGKQLEFYDWKLKNGFGVRIGRRSKTFFIVYRSGGHKVRYTIGRYLWCHSRTLEKPRLRSMRTTWTPRQRQRRFTGSLR